MKVPNTVFVALFRVLYKSPDSKEKRYLMKWMTEAQVRREALRQENEKQRHDRIIARS